MSSALRLIGESGPEDGGMEELAERLGVGARHLRRLFLKHLGATPNAIAQTRRVHFAKKLIDETNLPMTELASAAGYGSVRRFNAAIRKTYHRTPTEIRAIARQKNSLPENQYLFRLRFRPPYDWKGMLAFLATSATPGVEAVDEISYRRTISLGGSDGSLEVSLDEKQPALRARIQFGDPRALIHIVERIRALFDLNADWSVIVKGLAADPLLASRLKANPGLRVAGSWSGFELATRAILGRGADTTGAANLAGRLVRMFGRPFVAGNGLTHQFSEPAALADADLASAGIPAAPAETIGALARAVVGGQFSFEKVTDSAAVLRCLRDIVGVDEWTAQYVSMRALGEPDAFPPEPEGLEPRSESWRPWRAYAAMYLWPKPDESAKPRAVDRKLRSGGGRRA